MKISLFIIFSLLVNICLGQMLEAPQAKMPPFGNIIYFESAITDSMRASGTWTSGIGITDKNIQGLLNKKWLQNNMMKSPIILGVKLNPTLTDYQLSPVKSFYKSYSAYKISDGSDAILIALGITKSNISSFRYHVVMNDSAEVIPWSPIPKLEQRYGAAAAYGFIGKFNYPGKQILVEVVSTKDYRLRDGVIFDWRKNFKPVITNIRVSSQDTMGLNHNTVRIVERKPPHGYNYKYDTATGTLSEIKFEYGRVSDIEIFLKDHESVPYNLGLYKIENGKKVYFGSPIDEGGSQTRMLFSINRAYQPGNYEMVIQPHIGGDVIMESQGIRIRVIILPDPLSGKKISLWYVVICLVISLLFFVIYRRSSNARLIRSLQAKQMVSLKLRSIRAQLNPHFMFNALTSIQNLVNKKDIESANHYLSRFADLTRKVLNTGERDLISLEDELTILNDYLQMEQLRFNFKYEFKADDDLNMANIEVPAMLLQPFVENAVKHGVAKLREEGLIKIQINKSGKNLLFSVIDNGRGFEQKEDETNASFGLKLSEERIKLLNDVYKDQPAELNIVSGDSGTTVTIKLNNWIS